MDRNAHDSWGSPDPGTSGTSNASGAASRPADDRSPIANEPASDAATIGNFLRDGSERVADDVKQNASDAADGAAHLTDRVRSGVSSGKDALQERLGTLRERANELQATLADKLDHGADKLRQRANASSSPASPAASASNAIGEGTLAYAGGGTSANARGADERMNAAATQLASGMTNTADWLRNGDLQKDIEKQVKEHPGRSLLIALGLGYLIGKSLKR